MTKTGCNIERVDAEEIADRLQEVRYIIGSFRCTNKEAHTPGDGTCNVCDTWQKLGITIELFKTSCF